MHGKTLKTGKVKMSSSPGPKPNMLPPVGPGSAAKSKMGIHKSVPVENKRGK